MIDDYAPHHYGDEIAREAILSMGIPEIEASRVGEYPESDLVERLPYISVELVDGAADFFTSEPIVDIDVFASTRAEAKSLAAAIMMGFLRYPRTVQVEDDPVTIDEVGITASPVKRPWEDPDIRRMAATIQLSVRR